MASLARTRPGDGVVWRGLKTSVGQSITLPDNSMVVVVILATRDEREDSESYASVYNYRGLVSTSEKGTLAAGQIVTVGSGGLAPAGQYWVGTFNDNTVSKLSEFDLQPHDGM